MKRMSVPKFMLKISLVFGFLLTSILAQAQVSGWIKTCYQNILFNGNRTIKLLDIQGNSVFSYGPATSTAFNYFAIRRSVNGEYILVPDHSSIVTIGPDGQPVTIYRNTSNRITLPTESVIIDLYSTSGILSLSLNVDFVSISEAFNFKPFGQSCFTYDNFRISSDITNLEGLCEIPWYYIKVPLGATDRKGLPSSFRRSLDFNGPDPASDPINIPIDPNECATTRPDGSVYAGPYPYGCMNFDLAIAFRSCYRDSYPKPVDCPDLTEVSVPIRVCCACTAPSPNSRNTDNAALSGQSNELSIFPNPNHTGRLEVNATNSPVRNIKIYAVDGRLVKEFSVPELNKVSVDISGLKPGMYQVKVTDVSNNVVKQKLVVQ